MAWSILLQEMGSWRKHGHTERSLAICEKCWGGTSETPPYSLNNLAVVLAYLEEYPEAIRLMRRAVAIRRKNSALTTLDGSSPRKLGRDGSGIGELRIGNGELAASPSAALAGGGHGRNANEEHVRLSAVPLTRIAPPTNTIMAHLWRNKADCSRNKADCSRNKADCSRNKADCSRNKADCSRNKADCSRNKADCSRNKADCSRNKADCSRNKAGCSRNKADCSRTEQIVRGTRQVVRETRQIIRGAKQIFRRASRLFEEQSRLFSRTKPCRLFSRRNPTRLFEEQRQKFLPLHTGAQTFAFS
ncbi:MAG: tetratricopeptide repeat protein [Chloroflexi bacterium]|nr:tetratricopeptide repeat protein [Chloroflexota bacterium]